MERHKQNLPDCSEQSSITIVLHDSKWLDIRFIGVVIAKGGKAYSIVSSGKASPDLVNSSNPAIRSWNSSLGTSEPRASIAFRAAYMISFRHYSVRCQQDRMFITHRNDLLPNTIGRNQANSKRGPRSGGHRTEWCSECHDDQLATELPL